MRATGMDLGTCERCGQEPATRVDARPEPGFPADQRVCAGCYVWPRSYARRQSAAAVERAARVDAGGGTMARHPDDRAPLTCGDCGRMLCRGQCGDGATEGA